jgi:hypothetical protein
VLCLLVSTKQSRKAIFDLAQLHLFFQPPTLLDKVDLDIERMFKLMPEFAGHE